MSNRRKHFPFGSGQKSPTMANPPAPCPSSYEMGKSRFHLRLADQSTFNDDTNLFVSNVHKCLTSCASYTQALNTLCGTGTHFAQCLANLFQNLHPYQEIAGQFLDVWENLSKATGSASAAVKTETLINLQDVLTRLESNEDKPLDPNCSSFITAENMQVLFSCLNSFLQLQALFSCYSWESLDKLAKTIEDPQDCSAVNQTHVNKITNNRLNDDIHCHFKPLFNGTDSQQSSNKFAFNSFNDKPSSVSAEQSLLPKDYSSKLWNNVTSSEISRSATPVSSSSSPMKSFRGDSNKNFASAEELQDVLELLSCCPESSNNAQSCPSLGNNSNCTPLSVDHEKPYVSCNPPSQNGVVGLERESKRMDFGKRTWPRMNGNVNPAQWGWMFPESDNDSVFLQSNPQLHNNQQQTMNSINGRGCGPPCAMPNAAVFRDRLYDSMPQMSYIPPVISHQKQPSDASVISNGHTKSWSSTQGDSSSSSEDTGSNDTENVFSIGLNIVVSDLMASVRQRRHSSTDGLPESESLDMNVPSSNGMNAAIDSTRIAKTSTWPLKQHNVRNNSQSSLFLEQDSMDYSAISPGVPLWNISSMPGQSPYSLGLEHDHMEKYSLFGKFN